MAAEALTGDCVAGTAAVELAGSVGLAGATGAAVAADLGGRAVLRGVDAAGFAGGSAFSIGHRLRKPGFLSAAVVSGRPIEYQ